MTAPADQLYHTELGDNGPRIAFLHGLFGQGRNWTSVAKQLSADHRVTLIDMPNHGRSAWTSTLSYAAMATAVGDLLAADPDPVAVVGHSMGGKIAMALALLRPALVERLCVVDVAPVRYPGLNSFARYVEGMRSVDLGSLEDRAAANRTLEPYVPDETVRGFLLQNLRRDGSGWRWQMNLQLLGNSLPDLGSWPDLRTAPYLGKVLWMAGQHSDYIRSEYAEAMRTLFPKVRQVTIKNAGHWVHSEQPEAFVATLRMFLGS